MRINAAYDDDHLQEECGVFGVFGHDRATTQTYQGLFALQHRGQEAAGIASCHEGKITQFRAEGLVSEVFKDAEKSLKPGRTAIGHVRYSTAGGGSIRNIQPLYVDSWRGGVALAHNGNLMEVDRMRKELQADGAIFQSTSDSELILHLLVRSKERDLINGLVDALSQVKGAYSMVILTPKYLIAARDPHGVRPLSLGTKGSATYIASETCAFDLLQVEESREIEPGEIFIVDATGRRSLKPFEKAQHRPCAFEHIYFSRPDSVVFGSSVDTMRREFGRQLALEHPVPNADAVIAVPDSGNYAALGYAAQSETPFEIGIIRNHYIGRTFIQPKQEERSKKVRIKLNPVRSVIEGRKLVVVDDSIVRGTTSKALMEILREAGAAKIHLRISSPPIKWSCYYGIDTPDQAELIAHRMTLKEMEEYIGVDSLGYLSLEGLKTRLRMAVGHEEFCTACWSGSYDVDFPHRTHHQTALPV